MQELSAQRLGLGGTTLDVAAPVPSPPRHGVGRLRAGKWRCGGYRPSVSNRPCISRVPGSIEEQSRCSWLVWAPSPSTPRPSSVATPLAAVRLPSEPPPDRPSDSSLRPTSPAIAAALANNSSPPALRPNGGRFRPPVTLISTSG